MRTSNRPADTRSQSGTYMAQYGTDRATLGSRVIRVGNWARNPLGGPSWHTSEGVCSDSILIPLLPVTA